VIGLLGGLGAALSWAGAAVMAARASRAIRATPTLGWVMVSGLILVLPTIAFFNPDRLPDRTVGYLALAGAANVAGLALEYLALRIGTIGVIAPLCSTEGAIAAVIAAIFGQVPSTAVLVTLAVIAVGVMLSAMADSSAEGHSAAQPTHPIRAAFLSMGAATLFGLNLFALARAGNQAPVVWTIWPARIMGTFTVALPLALRGDLKLPRGIWPFVVGAGLAEVTGILSYAVGSHHGVAVPAVVGSQFAGLAALGGFLLFGERLTRRQVAGLAVIAGGVAALAVLQA
jgi:drug/metabolite transporter (DMT)-like permease